MDPKSMLWNSPPPPPRKSREAEPLWTVIKDGHRTEAQLLGHGEYGWEIQLLRDGEFLLGRRFELRAQAVAYGENLYADLEADGWRLNELPSES